MRVYLVRASCCIRHMSRKLGLWDHHLTLKIKISSTLDKDRLSVAVLVDSLASSRIHVGVKDLVDLIK